MHIRGHLPSVCDFPFGEWAVRHLLISGCGIYFFKSQCCGVASTDMMDSHLYLFMRHFVWNATEQRIRAFLSSVFSAQAAPFPPVPHKWTCTSLHLSWLSVSVSFFSGRRCRSTMWRQVSSTREITWTAHCLTATATFWPASRWRSSPVRFLHLL